MKEFRSWNLWDRSFLYAVLLSLLWHFFWFFSVRVVVSPDKKMLKTRPRIVSLGPVLDDSIFRMLVQNKPQLSETFYRHLSDFAPGPEPPVRTIERHEAGEVVSVPDGKKFLSAMHDLLQGDKVSPESDFFSKITIGYGDENLGLEGALKDRQILSRPPLFEFPSYLDPALKTSLVEIEFTVDPSGSVNDADVVVSSGSLELDALWRRHVRGWQFVPLPAAQAPKNQAGSVKLRFEEPAKGL